MDEGYSIFFSLATVHYRRLFPSVSRQEERQARAEHLRRQRWGVPEGLPGLGRFQWENWKWCDTRCGYAILNHFQWFWCIYVVYRYIYIYICCIICRFVCMYVLSMMHFYAFLMFGDPLFPYMPCDVRLDRQDWQWEGQQLLHRPGEALMEKKKREREEESGSKWRLGQVPVPDAVVSFPHFRYRK